MGSQRGRRFLSWRQYPRVIPDDDLPLLAWVEGDGLSPVLRVRDIGEGGLDLELTEPLPQTELDRKVSLQLSLPPPVGGCIRTSARIRHIEMQHIGLYFEHLTPADRKRLQEYVRLRSGSPGWLRRLCRHWLGSLPAQS